MVGWVRACGVLAAVIGLALASGCREARRDGKIALRLSGYAGNPAETDLMRELVDDFNASQAQISARYEPVPGQYYPKLLTMLASRTAPDVFYLDILYFQPFIAKRSILLPLDDFLATSSTKASDFIPSLIGAFSDKGKVYGIPKDFNTFGLYYNRESFDRAGLSYPSDQWDLFRFRDVAERLTRNTGPAPRHGFALTPETADRFLPVAAMFGARLYAPDGSCAIASPAGVKAMEYYASLRGSGAAIFPSEVGSSWAGDAFGREQAAMVFEGSWLTPYLAESFPRLGYGISQLPRGPAGRSNFLFTVAYVIPQSARHPEASWKLIEYLTSASAQERITFALPSRKAVSARFVSKHPQYRPILDAAAYAEPYAFGPQGNRVNDRLGLAVQEVLLGVKSPQQALAEAAAAIDRINRL